MASRRRTWPFSDGSGDILLGLRPQERRHASARRLLLSRALHRRSYRAVFTGAALSWSLLWSGLLVVAGALIASASLWKSRKPSIGQDSTPADVLEDWLARVAAIGSEGNLRDVTNMLLERLSAIGSDYEDSHRHDREMRELLRALGYLVEIWDGLDIPRTHFSDAKLHHLLRAA